MPAMETPAIRVEVSNPGPDPLRKLLRKFTLRQKLSHPIGVEKSRDHFKPC